MGEKKLHYKMYKDGKKFVFAAIATLSFVVFGGVSTVAVHADTTSGNLTAATVNSTSDKKSAVSPAATVASSASDTKSAAQSAATVASSASDTKSAAQSAATAVSSASDTNSFVQLMADNATAAYNSTPIDDATSQTNLDGKTQYSSLDNAQNLSFESNSQDSNAPTATGVNLTGTYTQAYLPQQFKNDGMTGDTFWLYSGADLLNSNVSITKNWANAGSINGRNVDFHETFHDFVAQNNPSTNGIWSITGVDTNNPYLILISSNAVDNIDVYNANFQETFWFTYSDDGSIVDITKFDQAHAAQNNNQIFYFLSASLSSNNGVGINRREYVQTNDAKTVVISQNPIYDPSTGFTAPASTMGLASVSGSNVPGGLVYTNTDPWGYQSPAGEDSNPDYYALQGGVTFANFTSNKPTLYLGAVPINASNTSWGQGPWGQGPSNASNTSWWHGNHNKNSDFLSFVTYSIVINKKVNETINYVDQTGKTVAPSDTANHITFITVKAWDGTTTYYKFGSQENPTLDNAGKPDSSWIQADNAKFGAIDNPTVKGYKVISTTAPGSDLNSVAIQTVNNTSDDLNFTVVYAPAYSTSEVKTVTETVHYIGQDGKPVANDASGIPTSFVTITNPVDGSTKNFYSRTETSTPKLDNDGKPIGDWQEGNSADFDSIANPTVNGYHVISTNDPDNNLSQITAKIVTKSSDNLVYKVIYAPNAEKANVTYIDDTTGKTLSTKDLSGAYGTTDPYRTNDTIAGYENAGYKLVSDNYPTSGVTYNEDGTVQSFQVHLTHSTTPVGPNNPEKPGEPINPDNPNGPKWPDGTDKNSLTKTVNQTIHYQYVGGQTAAPDKTDSTTFDHQVEVDKVTGKIVKDDGWSAENDKTSFDSKNSPVIPGYTASKPASDSVDGLTQDSKDNVQTIIYTSNHEAANVTYIDDKTGKTLSAKDLTGDYGSTDPYRTGDTIADYEKQGYQLVSDNYPAKGVVYNQDGTVQSFEVHLTHGTTQTSESQTVNETIHYVYKNGDKAADDYQATPLNFTRTVTTDKVTGDKSSGDWVAANGTSFASVTSPTIKGYTPDQAQIDTITGITADSADIEKTVTYVANKEAAKVTYIDDTTGKTLSVKDLTGDYGSTDPYRTGDTIADYEKQGYQLVSDNYPTKGVVYNQDGTVQSFEVHLTHGTTPVGPNNPQTPGTPINPDNPDGPKWPEGTDKSSVTQTVIRTVNYLDKQTGKVVAKQVTEQVTYNRTAIVDKVTGQIIGYSTTGGDTVDQTDGDKAWTAVDNKSDWDSVTSPDLSSKGYLAPDLAAVAQQTVTPGDKDVTVNVHYVYTKNP